MRTACRELQSDMRLHSNIEDAFGLPSLHSNICISSILILVLMFLAKLSPALGDNRIRGFTERFRSVSGEELYELWHTDCHRRCTNELQDHVLLGCSFDPYKIITKRSVNSTVPRPHVNQPTGNEKTKEASIFLSRYASASFLATYHKRKTVGHKIAKRGIMEECCNTKPCSWEEYAEYCNGHNRLSTDRTSRCYK